MNFDDYQAEIVKSCTWKKGGDYPITMTVLGICEESGEVAGEVMELMLAMLSLSKAQGKLAATLRKANRDNPTAEQLDLDEIAEKLMHEGGDVLWGLGMLADALGRPLSEMAALNVGKMHVRHAHRYGKVVMP